MTATRGVGSRVPTTNSVPSESCVVAPTFKTPGVQDGEEEVSGATNGG